MMAGSRTRLLPVLAAAALSVASGSKLYDSIYTALTPEGASRLLNEDGMIGSNTDRNGDTGVLYRISSLADLAAYKSAPKRDYVALVANSVLGQPAIDGGDAVLAQLKSTGNLKGVLLYDDDGKAVPFSAGSKTPNRDYGMTKPELPKHEWNPHGGGFNFCDRSNEAALCGDKSYGMHWTDLDVPFFLLSPEDAATTLQRFEASNNAAADQNGAGYPLLGARLKFFQWAAPDTATCERRIDGGVMAFGVGFPFCQSIGGQSILGFLRPYTQDENQGVVMLSAATDAVSMLHTKAFGADADALAVVALLGAAGVVGQVPAEDRRDLSKYSRNILFSFFTGEKWGYIGSSSFAKRVLHDNDIPTTEAPLKNAGGQAIEYYIELDQLQPATDGSKAFFTHGDTAGGDTTKVSAVEEALAAAANAGGKVSFAQSGAQEMPPSSYRALFAEKPSGMGDERPFVGGVVVSGYDTQYNNKHFETRKDDGNSLGVNATHVPPALTEYVCGVATAVANAALRLAANGTGFTAFAGAADCDYIAELILAITFNQTSAAGKVHPYIAPTEGTQYQVPANRYVDVYFHNPAGPRAFQNLVYEQLSTQLAKDVPSVKPSADARCADVDRCCEYTGQGGENADGTKIDVADNRANYWNRVAIRPRNGTDFDCYTTTAYWINAPSPAFQPDGSKMLKGAARDAVDPQRRYPTWAESTWDTEALEIFLVGNPGHDVGVLVAGIFYFIGCAAGVWQFNKKVVHAADLNDEALRVANDSL